YLRFVADLAERGRADAIAPLALAEATDLGPFAALTDSERLVANLHRAYAEAGGTPPGDPIDYLSAFSDMLTLNGGGPLRCLAWPLRTCSRSRCPGTEIGSQTVSRGGAVRRRGVSAGSGRPRRGPR